VVEQFTDVMVCGDASCTFLHNILYLTSFIVEVFTHWYAMSCDNKLGNNGRQDTSQLRSYWCCIVGKRAELCDSGVQSWGRRRVHRCNCYWAQQRV